MLTDQLCPLRLDATWIPRALLLSEEAGWNQNAADWEVFLRHGTVLGFSIGDRLVATAAVLPYGDTFGWISMVLVTAEWRRHGLATRLVAACTSLLRDAGRAALLDAAPAATAIYAALGFIPMGTLERWEGHGGGKLAATAPVEPCTRPIRVRRRPVLLAGEFPVAATQSGIRFPARLCDLAPGLLSLAPRPHRCRTRGSAGVGDRGNPGSFGPRGGGCAGCRKGAHSDAHRAPLSPPAVFHAHGAWPRCAAR